MIYNNPISYGNDLTPEMFAELAPVPNFVALKESSGNTRRLTDLHRVVGGRYAIFTGVDDLVLESAHPRHLRLGRRQRHRVSGREPAFLGVDPPGPVGGSAGSFTTGSPPCCTWIRTPSSSSTSNWRSRNAGWGGNGCARRGCRSRAGSASTCCASSMMAWRPRPELLKRVAIIDSHTGGEPTRVVWRAAPDLAGGAVADQLVALRAQHDAFRSAVVNEPRGSDVMVGALLVPAGGPSVPDRRDLLQQRRLPGHVRARHDRPGGDAGAFRADRPGRTPHRNARRRRDRDAARERGGAGGQRAELAHRPGRRVEVPGHRPGHRGRGLGRQLVLPGRATTGRICRWPKWRS